MMSNTRFVRCLNLLVCLFHDEKRMHFAVSKKADCNILQSGQTPQKVYVHFLFEPLTSLCGAYSVQESINQSESDNAMYFLLLLTSKCRFHILHVQTTTTGGDTTKRAIIHSNSTHNRRNIKESRVLVSQQHYLVTLSIKSFPLLITGNFWARSCTVNTILNSILLSQ